MAAARPGGHVADHRRGGGGPLALKGNAPALKGNAPALRAALHAGNREEDYVTTVKVLRRFVRNAGGTITL
ncbi:hypothetical protein [Streptomyces californicus]|uniref:hypothetical protein n=1 Tax=Streptomyces californicus TaxID=67351 RepID=UPI0037141C11